MLEVGFVHQLFWENTVHFLVRRLSALWPPLGVIKFPSWSQVIPEFQALLLVATFSTLSFYNFVESPWYMNLVVFWVTAIIVLGAVLIYFAFSKEEPKC